MMVTLLAFSYNVLAGIEVLRGSPLSDEEQAAYLHLWRYIGFLMGVRDDLNPCKDMRTARARLESLLMHLAHPDDSSRKLVTHMLKATSSVLMPFESRGLFLRMLLGSEWSDRLRLPKPGTASALARVRVGVMFYLLCLHTRVCSLPVIGDVLLVLHTWWLRLVFLLMPVHRFPFKNRPNQPSRR
mmetsp:Transcript_17155/g.42078  ORF Transcript_17155/g.42078 Transcript_17155/m.42078 type:complete len:185 (+) Transcript_17155:79-633(+)